MQEQKAGAAVPLKAGAAEPLHERQGKININPPGQFSFVPEEWAKYKQRFLRYMNLAHTGQYTEQEKIDCLLYCMGEKAEDIIIQFEKKYNFNQLISNFDNFFSPKKNVIFERYKFNSKVQKESERFDEFATELHKLAESCEYGLLKEELIRDRIVVGAFNKNVSDRMLLKSDLTLKEAMLMCKQAEIQEEECRMMRGQEEIAVINRIKDERGKVGVSRQNKCWFCGRERHQREKCPAAKATCHNCQRVGHFSNVCRSKSMRRLEEQKDPELEFEVCFCESKDSYTVPVSVYESTKYIDTVNFLIDTGADVTAITEAVAEGGNLTLVKCMDIVKGPDGTRLDVVGTAQLRLIYKGNEYVGKVYVIKGLKTSILGRPSIDSMNLITISALSINESYEVLIEKEFPNIFDELGLFKDEFHIKLIKNPTPYIHASPRSISIPLLPKVKQELDRLQSLGIISPIEEATDFVSPIVAVFKNGKVRICGDYTQVNKNILRPVFPIPKVENTLAKLKGAKYFSKIDATSGFHQIKLDDNSKKLTTIITPFGRYIYNRLPFGLNCAPEYFSMKFSNLFKDLKVVIHMDDILIFEENKEKHDILLKEVLKRLHDEGLTINKSKCVFGVMEISYLGHVINAKGIKVEPERIKVINNFKAPSNKTELLQFLGMVNFVGRFLANKSQTLKPLYELLKEDRMFIWGLSQQQAFGDIKKQLQEAPNLAHYDPSSKVIVSADASSFGLGAALMQEDKEGKRSVVMYASRILTEAERHYAQIEKECLALTWAAEKFRDYIVGIHVYLETDHKPLLQILQTKQFDDLSPRLLNLRLKLTRFDYEVIYTPGKDLIVADTLSRQPHLSEEKVQSDDKYDLSLNLLDIDTIPNETLLKIQAEQEKCTICTGLKDFTINGWPNKNQLGVFKDYYQYRDNFSIESGIILFNSRIVIPKVMQDDILNKIHAGHLGISRCRERAKQSVWWLGLSKQIENKVKTCSTCIELYRNYKEEMLIDPIPDRPWQKVGLDLFKFNNSWYLVIIDYYSRFLEISKIKDLTEDTVIMVCKEVFSRYGIPELVRSDCGTQFKTKFNLFAKEYGFTLITSSPYYSQSNGMAESGVKIAKGLLGKNEDIHLALLIYRNTPAESGYSPAELMFNRKLRDNLPMIPSKLNNPVIVDPKVKEIKQEKKYRDAVYYNKRHRAIKLDELQINDRVWITDLKTYGTVTKKCKEPRSFIVNTNRGSFRRNRWHLNLAPNISPMKEKGPSCDSVHSDFYDLNPPSSLSDTSTSVVEDSFSPQHSEPEPLAVEQERRRSERQVRRPTYLDDFVCN